MVFFNVKNVPRLKKGLKKNNGLDVTKSLAQTDASRGHSIISNFCSFPLFCFLGNKNALFTCSILVWSPLSVLVFVCSFVFVLLQTATELDEQTTTTQSTSVKCMAWYTRCLHTDCCLLFKQNGNSTAICLFFSPLTSYTCGDGFFFKTLKFKSIKCA